jgi:hypothetical protein
VTVPTSHGEGASRIDEAALLGTALAAILALTLGEGGWDWLGPAIGAALIATLTAFFDLPAKTDRKRWRELVALACVAALCAALVLAWPWQVIYSRITGAGSSCKAIAEAHEAWWTGNTNPEQGLTLDRRRARNFRWPAMMPANLRRRAARPRSHFRHLRSYPAWSSSEFSSEQTR